MSDRPIAGGQLIEQLHATGEAKRLDAAARRAGFLPLDEAVRHLTNPQRTVLVAINDRHGRLEGLAEVADLVGGLSAADAAVRRLIDIGLAAQSGRAMPVHLTPRGREAAVRLRGLTSP